MITDAEIYGSRGDFAWKKSMCRFDFGTGNRTGRFRFVLPKKWRSVCRIASPIR